MPTYCRAYPMAELRRFPGFDAAVAAPADDAVVFVWDDLTVVDSPVLAAPTVLWADTGPAWRAFCEQELGFSVPPDLVPDVPVGPVRAVADGDGG